MAVKIYLDTADIALLQKYALDNRVAGITTNPALMKKVGVTSYHNFGRIVLGLANGKPVSFEVIADDFDEMERQARTLASWSDNVFVKIPITNTKGESTIPLIKKLEDLHLNITAVMTLMQIEALQPVLGPRHIMSVFAGRIADTGRDPMHIMRKARLSNAKLLWASAREVLNVYQAEECGCDIITLTPELIGKLELHGKSLSDYSLETVKMFHNDGKGLKL
jgi:transaldolase